MFVDVHCHLDSERFAEDVSEVIARAKAAGVSAIISNGTNVTSNRAVLEIARKFPIVKAALGLYPLDALGYGNDPTKEPGPPIDVDAELAFIEMHANEVIALGEVGLDNHWIKKPVALETQKVIFGKVIDLAMKIGKPLIVHSRSAEKDVIDMLEAKSARKVVMHCFGGRKSLIDRAVKLGYSFSIPPSIVRLEHFRMIVDRVPMNQLLTETDAPWQGAVSGERNEPANVKTTIEWIAKIKGFTAEEVVKNVWMNFQRLFS